jgi:hypothetical protein
MRTLPYKILTAFGKAITKEEYLTTKLVYKEVGKLDIYYNISEVVFGLAYLNYTTLYLADGRKFVYCKGFSVVCLWFPDNFFDCFNRGEFMNTSLIVSHTGRYQKIVSIFLLLDFILVVSDSQRSRFLDHVDKNIIIKKVTKAIQRILTAWQLTGRQKRIDDQ